MPKPEGEVLHPTHLSELGISDVEHHVLFDVDPGIVDSLIDAGIRRVDYVRYSHNHFDHVGDAG